MFIANQQYTIEKIDSANGQTKLEVHKLTSMAVAAICFGSKNIQVPWLDSGSAHTVQWENLPPHGRRTTTATAISSLHQLVGKMVRN